MEHFGVQLRRKDNDYKLTRENFAPINTKPSLPYFDGLAKRNAYVDETGSAYREEWCEEYRKICLENYDLNMKCFSMLDESEFNEAIHSFLEKYKCFKEISDLTEYMGVEGFYLIVLDEYKQVYIGKSEDIKRRIMQHWSTTKQFDRTLLPMYAYTKSCFSIDFFRALDTTRIYVWKKKISIGVEAELVSNFPSKFCTNRIGGDVTTLIKALETMNTRTL